MTPLLKLTHKINHEAASDNSVYRYLCNRLAPEFAKEPSASKKPDQALRSALGSSGPVAKNKSPILVMWFGTLAGHGTIGDLFSAQAVCALLRSRGYNYFHSSATSEFGIIGPNVNYLSIDPNTVKTVIFACGPIIAGHPAVTELINRFPVAKKIGVGVSLFDPNNPLYSNPFDCVLAREGQTASFEDVAILAPRDVVPKTTERPLGKIRIGLALRGLQGEYGTERSLHAEARHIIDRTISEISRNYDVETVFIEHRLQDTQTQLCHFEDVYADCDLVITTRFHGGILSMRNGVPFLAIDQIAGGAKVAALLGGRGWPHVYLASSGAAQPVCSAAAMINDRDYWKTSIRDHARKIKKKAALTLQELDNLLSESMS